MADFILKPRIRKIYSLKKTAMYLIIILIAILFFYLLRAEERRFIDTPYYKDSKNLEQNLIQNPIDASALIRLGEFYYRLGKTEESWLNNRLSREYEFQYCLDQLKKWGEIGYNTSNLEVYLTAKGIDEDFRKMFIDFQLTVCDDAYNRSLKYYKMAKSINEKILSPKDYFTIGVLYFKSGQDYLLIAEEYVLKSVNNGYKNAESYTMLGNIYHKLGNYKKAEDYYFNKALNINPEDPVINLNLALTYVEMEKYLDAQSRLELIINDAGERSNANILINSYILLGEIFFKQNDDEKAIFYYNEALKVKQNILKPHYFLTLAYRRQGDLDKARETIKKAYEINPENKIISNLYYELIE